MKKLVNKTTVRVSLLFVCLLTMGGLLGCQDPKEIAKEQGDAEPQQQKMQQQAVVDLDAEKPQNDTKKSIIHKTTAVVVDAKKALKDPDVSVVDGKIKGVDPYTQAGSAYVSMASRVSTFGMQQAIKTHKALNDRFPSYDEYMKMMKENRIQFAELPPYLMYGYDDETGNILVLSDNKKKAQLYKEAGIPLD